MLVNEDGPFDIFDTLRLKVGVRYDANNMPYGDSFLSILFSCIWCMSIWVAAAFVVVATLSARASRVITLILSLSATAIVVENKIGKV